MAIALACWRPPIGTACMTELVGADAILTMTHQWQARFNQSGVDPTSRIALPVDSEILAELLSHFPDFRRAYEPAGMTETEFRYLRSDRADVA